MAASTYSILCAIGLLLPIGAFVSMARTKNRGSLTAWILAAIGVGILVGGSFRMFSPSTLAPEAPRVEGTTSGPFDLPPSVLSFTVQPDEGTTTRITLPAGQQLTADALAARLAEQARGQVSIFAKDGQIIVRGLSKGAGRSLTLQGLEDGAGAVLGMSSGTVEGAGDPSGFTRRLHAFLRTLFLNGLKMMIIPIIFTSIISGMLSLGANGKVGRIGLKTLGYYMTTSLLAILAGLVLVNLLGPGKNASIELADKPAGFEDTANQTASEFLFSFFERLIPTNPIGAMVEGNVLQVIVFALLIGVFIPRLEERYRLPLTNMFEGLFETMMRIVRFVLWLAPVGVYAIFVMVIGETGVQAFRDLGLYALTVFIGLLFHAAVSLPLLLKVLGRVSPWRHFKAMGPALLTAFSTSSSSATLPFTMRCVENRAGVSNRTSSFVLPLGATVNMDGTALYECVAAIFIAQIYIAQGEMPPLTVGQQFLVVFTALAASIGAAGVPMAGMVMIGIILRALGLPLEGIGYILAVDRVLDMCRTVVNVWSDSVGCALIARTEGETDVLAVWPPRDDVIPHGVDDGVSKA